MSPLEHIAPPNWMRDQSTQRILTIFGAGSAYFVGGCVRDTLLGRPVYDVDIATRLTPDEVQAKLREASLRFIPTGIDHGTLTVIVADKTFEVTSLRKDVATDGRRAVVAFTQDWAEDAARRDFTVNTLLADGAGNIYDPLAQGLADLKNKRLRFVGDPAQRIAEDYLRILRYFRFAAQFGWTIDDGNALAACREAAAQVKTLSRERVTQELLKLLAADNPSPILSLMKDQDILQNVLGAYDAQAMDALISRHPLTRLSLLGGEESLALSNQQKRHLVIVRAERTLNDAPSLKRLIYEQGNEMAYEAYAACCARHKKEPQTALLDLLQNWQAPVFPVTGDDLIAQGYKAGPALGSKLKELEEEWLAGILSA